MNLNEMLIETFNNLGRSTDVSPLDRLDDDSTLNPDLQGYKQLQNWINQGYKAITTWRTPRGKFYRFRDMVDRKYIQWGPHIITGLTTYTTDGSELGYDPAQHVFNFSEDDFYVKNVPPAMVLLSLDGVGSHLEFEEVEETVEFQSLASTLEYQQIYRAIDADWVSLAYFTDDHTLYTLEPLPWVVAETIPTIYERGMNWARMETINPLTDLYAIRDLRIIDNKHDMDLAARTENFTQNLAEVGIPSEYFREGRYIYFDRHLDQTYTLQLEYYREANPLDDGLDSPVIPERYHTPIVFWASYRGLLSLGENTDAYSMKGFLNSEMESIIKEEDLDVERLEGNFRAGFNSGGYSYHG